MGVLTTVKDALRASSQSAARGADATGESKGAYWCHGCSERVLDLAVDGEEPPACPSCGDEMTFERSAASTGCAC